MARLGRIALASVAVLVALPAPAGAARPAAARRAPFTPPAVVAPLASLPGEASGCLFSLPGLECSEEEHRLCDATVPPDPVLVDCRDPANAWVQEMVGDCDMPRLAAGPAIAERERDHSHEAACIDGESCAASDHAAAGVPPTFDFQPAIAGVSAHQPELGRRIAPRPERLREDRGFPREIEHPPRA